MQFTYNSYMGFISQLKIHGYHIASYWNWQEYRKPVILRHDIDNDLQKAYKLAGFEGTGGVKSTYFVLLTSNFYNVFSRESGELLRGISGYGHDIGLHFDETRYPECFENENKLAEKIKMEAGLLEAAVEMPIKTVSMHRPSRWFLDADMKIPGMINSYGKEYFREFKYLSDSRRRWREPVEKIVSSGCYNRLHILTHAFWYNEEEMDLHGSLLHFIKNGNTEKYRFLQSNFTNLEEVVLPEEALWGGLE